MRKRFEDKVVFVSGAASGIGRATAELFAEEGARVACADVDMAGLSETVATLEKGGAQAIAIDCNVADPASANAAIARCVDELAGLHVLCNVAGVLEMERTEAVTTEGWNRIIDINLSGTFHLSHAALPHLLANDAASIVNTASLAGLMGQAYSAAYCASKAGVIGLTRAMAVEFVKQGLRVNCVCPGGVPTPLISNWTPPEGADSALMARLTLAPALTGTDEVAEAIVYLASPGARSINGVSLPLDFGCSIA
jgi:meso-butanediol dehydrogenase/(S,S)-butanediol dehydrogenase/diacetyl reductase